MSNPRLRFLNRALVQPATAITSTFQRFLKTESASGILLLAAAVVALVWANSPWAETYFHTWHLPFTVQLGQFKLTLSLHHWINDGLMAIFFLLVGLEIKREVVVGELSSPRHAMLPIATALGGMLVPALIYVAFNAGKPGSIGWGIPMATDIAFALGILTLVGRGVPVALKVMLTALAIVDDLGAVIVIAVFYTADLAFNYLLAAGGIMALLVLLNYLNIRVLWPYLLLGLVLWFVVLQSGVHATIAGVLLALTIPVRSRYDKHYFLECAQSGLSSFQQAQRERDGRLLNEAEEASLYYIELLARGVQGPLQRLEHALKNGVAFLIMPLFALVNAGVAFGAMGVSDLTDPVTTGATFGLLLGKPIGVLLAAFLVIRFGWAAMPRGATWAQVIGLACLAGIGFTMSLFIAELAFQPRPHMLDHAKLGILLGTILSALVGTVLLRRAMRLAPPAGA